MSAPSASGLLDKSDDYFELSRRFACMVHGHRVCGRLMCRALQLSQFRTLPQSSYNLYYWSFVMEVER